MSTRLLLKAMVLGMCVVMLGGCAAPKTPIPKGELEAAHPKDVPLEGKNAACFNKKKGYIYYKLMSKFIAGTSDSPVQTRYNSPLDLFFDTKESLVVYVEYDSPNTNSSSVAIPIYLVSYSKEGNAIVYQQDSSEKQISNFTLFSNADNIVRLKWCTISSTKANLTIVAEALKVAAAGLSLANPVAGASLATTVAMLEEQEALKAFGQLLDRINPSQDLTNLRSFSPSTTNDDTLQVKEASLPLVKAVSRGVMQPAGKILVKVQPEFSQLCGNANINDCAHLTRSSLILDDFTLINANGVPRSVKQLIAEYEQNATTVETEDQALAMVRSLENALAGASYYDMAIAMYMVASQVKERWIGRVMLDDRYQLLLQELGYVIPQHPKTPPASTLTSLLDRLFAAKRHQAPWEVQKLFADAVELQLPNQGIIHTGKEQAAVAWLSLPMCRQGCYKRLQTNMPATNTPLYTELNLSSFDDYAALVNMDMDANRMYLVHGQLEYSERKDIPPYRIRSLSFTPAPELCATLLPEHGAVSSDCADLLREAFVARKLDTCNEGGAKSTQ